MTYLICIMFKTLLKIVMYIVLVYKCISGVAPSYLLSEFRHAHQIHSHFTIQRDRLRLPLAKTTIYQGSFRINVLLMCYFPY